MKALSVVIALALTMISATSMATDISAAPCPYRTQTPGLRDASKTAFVPKGMPANRSNGNPSSQAVDTGS